MINYLNNAGEGVPDTTSLLMMDLSLLNLLQFLMTLLVLLVMVVGNQLLLGAASILHKFK